MILYKILPTQTPLISTLAHTTKNPSQPNLTPIRVYRLEQETSVVMETVTEQDQDLLKLTTLTTTNPKNTSCPSLQETHPEIPLEIKVEEELDPDYNELEIQLEYSDTETACKIYQILINDFLDKYNAKVGQFGNHIKCATQEVNQLFCLTLKTSILL